MTKIGLIGTDSTPSFSLFRRFKLLVPRASAHALGFFLLLSAFLAVPQQGLTQPKALPSPQPSTHRILVKLQPSLAQQVESELPAQGAIQAMTIQPGRIRGAGVQSFLTRYSPSRLVPLYPGMIRARQQHGWSDAQLADHLRQQFSKRAARQPNPAATPEISRTYVLDFPGATAQQIDALVQQLQADPDVEFAEPDKIVTTSQLPNDHFLSTTGSWGQSYQDLWGHYKVNAPTAWNTALGDGIIVAVVDTGIDYTHLDIAANVWQNAGETPGNNIDDDGNGFIDDVRGWDFIGSTCTNPTQSNDPIDHFGHGTHVAGTIAAVGNNTIGIIGIAWHAQVMALKGLDDGGCGLESTLAPAIEYAANNGADIINASWGGQGTSLTIEQAIQFAYGLGVVFVAAAGNSSADAVNFFPANSPEAITVAASDAFDNFASFSNFGAKIDVTAPGVDVLSLQANGTQLGLLGDPNFPGYIRLSGTSMATPHVAGTAALILSQHTGYSPEDVRQVLRASATNSSGWDPQFGYGIANAQAALALTGVLDAHISSPAGGTHLNSPVTVSGIAQGSGFDHYVLEFGAGLTPATWTQLSSSITPVANGPLGTFDPTTSPDGVYTVRLTVFDGANHAFSDRLEVIVDYVAITSPVPPSIPVTALEFKPGAQISISGMATGPSFSRYRIQWAEGIAPSSGWGSSGITLVGGGAAPVSSGPLGAWDTSSITQADYYTIRLQVDDAGFTSEADTLVYLEPSLISPNWPQPLVTNPEFGVGFLPLADASGNQQLAMVTPSYLGSAAPPQYLSFSPDGSSVNAINIAQPSYLNPAVGNIDGAPGGELVAPEAEQIEVFHTDNSSFTFQKPSGFDFYNLVFGQGVLEDIDGNSQLDVVDLADLIDNTFGPTASLFVWRPDGSMLNSNFPIIVPDQNTNVILGFQPRVLVGDIQGAGSSQFLVQEGTSSSQFTLGLFAHDGTPIPWSVPVFSGQPLSMVLADLDHNGVLETLLVMFDSSQSKTMLHVFQPDGSERPGWPVALTQFGGMSYMAVGDLNRDGTEEIVVTVQNVGLFVLEPDGTPFPGSWPQGLVAGPVELADIDGDGYPEILLSQYSFGSSPNPLLPNAVARAATPSGKVEVSRSFENGLLQFTPSITPSLGSSFYTALTLVALRRDASVARVWNLLGIEGNQPFIMPTVTVGDFNRDGTTDLAINYFTNSGFFLNQGVAVVLSTGAPFNGAVNDWPMTFQNPRNTSVQRRSITLSLTAPANGTTVHATTPVTAQTTGTVASLQFKLDGANLGGPVTNAPFTIQWDTTQTTAGPHTLAAVATDSSGRPVASAPINVTVSLGTASSVAVALTAGSNPSTFGGSLTFTASVTPNTATGSVIFFDGANAISGSVPLSGASASFTTTLLGSGSHSITAQYSGDSNVASSTSPVLTQQVGPAVLTITANNASRAFGAANPAFSGTITGAVNGDVFTETFSTTATSSSPVGSYAIVPGVTGSDLANYTVTPVNGTLTVTPAVLTITANDASRAFGAANPAFSGTITGAVNGDAFTESFSGPATLASPVGTYAIVPSVTGADLANYTVAPVNGTLSVVKAGNSVGLLSSNTNVLAGTPVTFTATVNSATSGTPTGSVQFLDGTTILGTVPLNAQGAAGFAISALSGGAHTVTAQYSGDGNFNASASAAVIQNIMDFAEAASPSAATIQAGGSATFTFTITPLGSFNQTVNFACSGLPSEAQCAFAPPSVTPNGAAVTTTLTITTTAPSAALGAPLVPKGGLPLYASLSAGMLGMVWLAVVSRRRGRVKARLVLAMATLCVLAVLASCGGQGTPPTRNPGTPPGTSQITVTTSSGSASHTASVTLVVN